MPCGPDADPTISQLTACAGTCIEELQPPEPLTRRTSCALLNPAALIKVAVLRAAAPGRAHTERAALAADLWQHAGRQLQSHANEALLKVHNGIFKNHIVVTATDVRQATDLSQSFHLFQELDSLFNLKAVSVK